MLTYDDIIKEDNPNLRKKSAPVKLPLSQEDLHIILKMNEYLENGYDEEKAKSLNIRSGVGLSAVQINILKQIFVIYCYDENQRLHHYGIINPKIISHSEQLSYLETGEGCLSVDREILGYVHRPTRITAKCHVFDFDTKKVEEKTLRLRGYLAIVFQHEYDHLQGILFTDRINKNNPFFVPENSSPLKFQ